MKTDYRDSRGQGRLRILVMGLALLCSAGVSAEMLTFDGSICEPGGNSACAFGIDIGTSYGSIPGKLDISYASRNSGGSGGGLLDDHLRFWDIEFGDLLNVAYARGGFSQVGEIVLKPKAGFQVTLNGLDLSGWRQDWPSQLTVYDLGFNVISTSGAMTVSGIGHMHFDFAIARTDGIIIQWGPDAFDVGIDNVDFTATQVPEPSLFLMLACGLGVVVLRLRARSRSIATASIAPLRYSNAHRLR